MRSLSLSKSIKNDYALVLSALLAVIPGGVGAAGLTLGWLPRRYGLGRTTISPSDAPVIYAIGAVLAVAGIAGFLHRWHTLRSLFETGIEVSGRIASVWRDRDRGRAEFTYQYQGAEFRSGVAIHKSEYTDSLVDGALVSLLIDPTRPKTAIISDLYGES